MNIKKFFEKLGRRAAARKIKKAVSSSTSSGGEKASFFVPKDVWPAYREKQSKNELAAAGTKMSFFVQKSQWPAYLDNVDKTKNIHRFGAPWNVDKKPEKDLPLISAPPAEEPSTRESKAGCLGAGETDWEKLEKSIEDKKRPWGSQKSAPPTNPQNDSTPGS